MASSAERRGTEMVGATRSPTTSQLSPESSPRSWPNTASGASCAGETSLYAATELLLDGAARSERRGCRCPSQRGPHALACLGSRPSEGIFGPDNH